MKLKKLALLLAFSTCLTSTNGFAHPGALQIVVPEGSLTWPPVAGAPVVAEGSAPTDAVVPAGIVNFGPYFGTLTPQDLLPGEAADGFLRALALSEKISISPDAPLGWLLALYGNAQLSQILSAASKRVSWRNPAQPLPGILSGVLKNPAVQDAIWALQNDVERSSALQNALMGLSVKDQSLLTRTMIELKSAITSGSTSTNPFITQILNYFLTHPDAQPAALQISVEQAIALAERYAFSGPKETRSLFVPLFLASEAKRMAPGFAWDKINSVETYQFMARLAARLVGDSPNNPDTWLYDILLAKEGDVPTVSQLRKIEAAFAPNRELARVLSNMRVTVYNGQMGYKPPAPVVVDLLPAPTQPKSSSFARKDGDHQGDKGKGRGDHRRGGRGKGKVGSDGHKPPSSPTVSHRGGKRSGERPKN